MDRREALKRLGVGGALAVSAPLLLDSFNVAHASSAVAVVDPPAGANVLLSPPLTTKTNSVNVEFNEDLFDTDGTLWFEWTVLHATPLITIDFPTGESSLATVRKATGNGNLNAFTIGVEVWEDVDGFSNLIARYLVVSDGGALTVTLQSP
jgi:hypothetical protein